ncbi:glycosyltransferase family 2 protein [Fimbriiglobus ruber]|uniref:Glycosyl transferase, family 2 n=1 Tax=Fimbriiglobus ruber TaxID=1908690 RepID=A0A225DJQ5_9BACT|nr:glycosyltransferase family 2 protein [Fimbriiglobus ruber]OWK36625.1 Glycosyl transferase, family 2 [Fimbriiglobus ruber]
MALVSVVVPVKDERANVRPLVARLSAALADGPPWEVVFVDDGSTDGTARELADLAADDDHVKFVRLRRNFGQSAAMQAGFDHASGDVIVTMDGDLQNDPADVPGMLAKLDEGYDVILGERACRQDKLFLRKLPSWAANWLIRKVTRVPFRDFGCTLRAMRREVVDGLTLYGEMHRFITAFAVQQGARVAQVPVNHHPRTAGTSKYNLTRTVRVMLDLMTVKFLDSYQTRPMHLFGGLGLMLLAVGTMALAAALVMKFTTGPGMTANPLFLVGAMLELMGVQFLSLGLMGEVMTRIYFESQGKPAYLVRETRGFAGRGRRVYQYRIPAGRQTG